MEINKAYNILGVSSDSPDDFLKKMYRKLLLKYHPDKNKDNIEWAEEKFKEVTTAYDLIIKRRSQPEPDIDFSSYGDFDFSHLFNTYFSSRNSVRRYSIVLPISLSEIFTGITKTIKVNEKEITINIPIGAYHGQRLKYTETIDSATIIINITIQVLQNIRFKIDQFDLYSNINVDLYTCILGGSEEFASINEKIRLKIEKGTPNNKTFRLKGKGLPVYNGYGMRGNLYLTINIIIPNELTQKELELYQELKKEKEKNNIL